MGSERVLRQTEHHAARMDVPNSPPRGMHLQRRTRPAGGCYTVQARRAGRMSCLGRREEEQEDSCSAHQSSAAGRMKIMMSVTPIAVACCVTPSPDLSGSGIAARISPSAHRKSGSASHGRFRMVRR